MASLYSIDKEFIDLMNLIENSRDDQGNLLIEEDVIRDTLEGMAEEWHQKADSYAIVMQEYAERASRRKAEASRLMELAKADDEVIEKLKKVLKESMELRNDTKFETDHFKFSIRKNGGAQPVKYIDNLDLNDIPDRFIMVKRELDKKEVRESLANGEELGFAWLEERGSTLQIK